MNSNEDIKIACIEGHKIDSELIRQLVNLPDEVDIIPNDDRIVLCIGEEKSVNHMNERIAELLAADQIVIIDAESNKRTPALEPDEIIDKEESLEEIFAVNTLDRTTMRHISKIEDKEKCNRSTKLYKRKSKYYF
jgi:hypothetical protein